MGRRRKGRAVSGVLLLDKPAGMTSNAALQKVRWLYQAQKAGHTGSLDPLATGLLPLCLGEATKFSRFLLEADKQYLVTARFGLATDTLDTDGKTLQQLDSSALTEKQLVKALPALRGEIEQVPPIYSALKRDGKPLYQYAREGQEVDIEPRPVTIHSLELLEFRPGEQAEADLSVSCSKGTYIRSLVRDLGERLNMPGTVARLRRTETGGFELENALTVEALEQQRDQTGFQSMDAHLLPVDVLVQHLPRIDIDANSSRYFLQGQALIAGIPNCDHQPGDPIRVYCEDKGFLGVAEVTDENRIQPKRLVVAS